MAVTGSSTRRNSRYVRCGGTYFFFIGAPQTQLGFEPSILLLVWTSTSQWHAGLVQCHCSPIFMIMSPVPLGFRLAGIAEKAAKAWACYEWRETIQIGKLKSKN